MTAVLNQRKGVAYRADFRINAASGAFAVAFPDLPGCVAGGGDFVQARDQAKRALDAWMDAALDRGEAVPAPAFHVRPEPAAHTVLIAARSGFEQRMVQSMRRPSRRREEV